MKGGDQANDGRLAGARGAYERGYGSRLRTEADIEQHRLALFVRETDLIERDVPFDGPELHGPVGIRVFRPFAQDFMRAIQARQRFRDLRPDADDAEYRRD